MMAHAEDRGLRSPEVAQLLGVSAEEVYRLIFAGELDGRPDEDGMVRVTRVSVDVYLREHGRGSMTSRV
jgi:hypothetical protein